MNKRHYCTAILCCLALLTGCSTEQPVVSSPETSHQANTEDTKMTEPVSSETAAPETTTPETAALGELYMRFHPIIEPELNFYLQFDSSPGIYEALQKMDAAYDEALESLESTYREAYADCTETAESNYMPDRSFQPVSDYDPITALLYRHQSDMRANPIELMTRIYRQSGLDFTRDRHDYYGMEDWYDFDYTYRIEETDMSDITEDTSPASYLLILLSNYAEIPWEKLRIGYSEPEDLYYCYFINFDDRNTYYEYKNLTLNALYFHFNAESGKPDRCGVETYVRTTDGLKNILFSAYGALLSHVGYRSYFELSPGKSSAWSSESFPTADEINDNMNTTFMPQAHAKHCNFVLSLLTEGNQDAAYTSENRAHFEAVDDFHSAMNSCCHITDGHFVTWFSLPDTNSSAGS